MAYISQTDLLDELGENVLVQLTDNDGDDQVDPVRIAKAIQYAKGVFDTYARNRYPIPVPSTEMVKAINLDLAVFHLYKSRTSIPEGIYKVKEEAKKDAIKLLSDISTGKAALDVPTAEETFDNPGTPSKVLTNKSNTKFSDEKLQGF